MLASKLLMLLTIVISSHPLLHIVYDSKYQCNISTSNSLYFNQSPLSNLATNPFFIVFSFTLGLIGSSTEFFWLILPLFFLTWKLYIVDRFFSLARGQGAPGYFCFLNIATVCLYLISSSYGDSHRWMIIIEFIKAIFIVEFGAIFLSAGLFKFFDVATGSQMGFALGMLNPMWSKVYNHEKIIIKFSRFINYLGPTLQVVGGTLILTGLPTLNITGFFIIVLIFLSITPQTRLGWLCPSIAVGSLSCYVSFNHSYDHQYFMVIFYICVALRLAVLFALFREYFARKSCHKSIQILTSIYRYFLGVIIWKVFTFDVVRYVCTFNSSATEFQGIYSLSANTNVYDSITLASLLASEDYLPYEVWSTRIRRAIDSFGSNRLKFIKIHQNKSNCIKSYDNFLSTSYTYDVLEISKASLGDQKNEPNEILQVKTFFGTYLTRN